MNKKAYFFIDDVIWVFRDLTRQSPHSIFEHHFMKILKNAHDQYGLKVNLNCFYRTDYYYGDDEFTLADMTDAYKSEWKAASDWLKMAFHAKQEYPDYPHVNASYDDIKNLFTRFEREVTRFAGENSLSCTCNPHWLPMSKDGMHALYDCGIKLIATTSGKKWEYNGDEDSLPFGHAGRLLCNRKPETMLYTRTNHGDDISRSICGYNHLSIEQAQQTKNNKKMILDEATGMYMKVFCNNAVLNNCTPAEIDEKMAQAANDEYVCVATHEQYAYSDYFLYQPETREKIFRMCENFKKNGFEYIFIEDLFEL